MKDSSIQNIFDLSNRIVLISGGTGFLGAHFASALASFGASVVAIDRFDPIKTGAQKVWDGFPGIEIQYMCCDISDPVSVEKLMQTIEVRCQKIDVLINCAAIDPKFEQHDKASMANQHFTSFGLEDWQQSLDVNVTGTFSLTQAVCRIFEKYNWGNIINICSTYGLKGPDQRIYNEGADTAFVKPISYTVTKAAVLGFTRYLASYYRGRNIRVNTLTPGGVEHGHDEEFIKRYSAKTIVGRMAQPRDLMGAIVFLASDASSYMTGANLVVDGGWTAF